MESLRESYRRLFESAKDGILILNAETVLSFFWLGAVMLYQDWRSFSKFKLSEMYEVEYQTHGARRKNKLSFISMARWEGIR